MKDIKQVYVHLNINNKIYNVGILAKIRDKIYFEYDPKFLKKGFELSPFQLPLKSGAKENKDKEFNSLFGLFHDSFLNSSIENSLHSLLNIKDNNIGALLYSLKKKIVPIEEDKLLDKPFLLQDITPSIQTEKILIQVDKRKNNIIYNKNSIQENYTHWMIKIPSSKLASFSGNIEYAYSLMAKKAGVEMPNSYLFKSTSKHSFFASKRFDRDGSNSFHTHTLAGLIHSDFRLHTLDYNDFLSVTLTITKNIKDVIKAFRVVCFSILSHIKNHNEEDITFIMNGKGDWHLAPNSNLTFSYGDSGKYSMKIMGERSWVKMEHLIQLAKAHDIKNYMQIIEEVSNAISNWISFATIANVPKEEALKIDTILKRINQK